ncbi:SMP-30/gluconolactonase/LRE family protein [Rhizobium sp. SEMIA 4085]|uniref:SMP-30/gluconolaconase/LRE domain-containing protein n=1 Tax=Rhizobium gallicum bv. gallicum R602sp TaxID=1041138 RepID=A0A0B4WZ93_9HYPH|nr:MULTISPECIES: SMP-30/gluconolactonase/LRE family protein [Rhizobium]AJD40271.1 SMP-30/gluconolaconase/LRE domain-containing protein [Rhizobium gallicum bv. gallicum R602sp]NNH29448.1 SMP-30/gluconolactonase/LRE family protein [Rhizobium sp. SEMIA 4085]TDW36670.1 sugar lactone lactonase YvrE [Rhizobium azibense]
MTEIYEFEGKTLCNTSSVLGEGPTYDPDTDTVWWFNILGKELHELNLSTEIKKVHPLPMMASVLARIDANRQLLATEEGLFVRDIGSGNLTFYAAFENDNPENRSNDGRTHPSGALWISTMSKRAEPQAGAIYHVAGGRVTKIFSGISIPNSICFSPDGTIGYYTDTRISRLMRVMVDPQTGLPTGEPIVMVDSMDDPGGIDGSVCDSDGYIWNARWGAGVVDRYSPDGLRIARYKVPAAQPSCPAFIGVNADRLAVTTAWEGLDDTARSSQPQAGALLELGVTVKGVFDPVYLL